MTVPSIGFSSPPCHVIGIGFAEVGFVLAFGAAADFASLKRQEHFAFTHSGLAVDVDTPF